MLEPDDLWIFIFHRIHSYQGPEGLNQNELKMFHLFSVSQYHMFSGYNGCLQEHMILWVVGAYRAYLDQRYDYR